MPDLGIEHQTIERGQLVSMERGFARGVVMLGGYRQAIDVVLIMISGEDDVGDGSSTEGGR